MKLIYCYINKYKNIKKQEVVFSHEYSVKIDNNGLHVSPNPSVCPYCEDEYIDVIINNDGANIIRTAELDHFFPKSEYPLLAMSYYNLIPSGKNCNHIKKSKNIGMCPYEEEIETKTYLYPDIPVGIDYSALRKT